MQIALFINHDSEYTKLFLKEELIILSNSNNNANILNMFIEIYNQVGIEIHKIKNTINLTKYYLLYTPTTYNKEITNELDAFILRLRNYNKNVNDIDRINYYIVNDKEIFNQTLILLKQNNNIKENIKYIKTKLQQILNDYQIVIKNSNKDFIKPNIQFNVSLLQDHDVITKCSLFDKLETI